MRGQRAGEFAGVRVAGVTDRQLACRCSAARRSAVGGTRRVAIRGSVARRSSAGGCARSNALVSSPDLASDPTAGALPLDDPTTHLRQPPAAAAAAADGRGGPRKPPPGLRAQFSATRDAAMALVMAHVDLAKAEASAIGRPGRPRRRARRAARSCSSSSRSSCSSSASSLFLGEWLFGSMGWGVLHGVLAFLSDRRGGRPARGRRHRGADRPVAGRSRSSSGSWSASCSA